MGRKKISKLLVKSFELAVPEKKAKARRNLELPDQETLSIEDITIRQLLERSHTMYQRVGKYPDEIKIFAMVLKQACYTFEEIAAICKVSKRTIQDWHYDPRLDTFELKGLADEIRKRFSDKLYFCSQTAFNEAMSDEKLKKANFQQLVWGASVMLDKARLLENKSTENVAHLHQSMESFSSTKDVLRQRLLENRDELDKLKAKLDVDQADNLTD